MNLLFDIQESLVPDIEGLSYIPDFIDRAEETALIAQIDQQSWLNDLKRRVQHYGYKYDYKARSVTQDSYLGPLPDWLARFGRRLVEHQIFDVVPEQAIINEYQPGQGISAHVDCVPCFGDVIASLSLGSGAAMQLNHQKTGAREEIYLEPRSLVVLSGAARYEWQHAIPARKSDMVDGFRLERGRRLSATFRNILRH